MTGARTLLKRLFSERTLLFASCATVLFATVMLAALTAYGTSVTDEGLRRTLTHPTFEQVGIQVSGPATDLERADGTLRSTLRAAFGTVPLDVGSSARSDSYVLPGQERLSHPQLTAFGYFTGIQAHANLVSGSWPGSTGSDVQAAVSAPAAAALHITAGQRMRLHSRLDGATTVSVRITGIYRINDRNDYFWSGNELSVTGAERLEYTTFGPLVVTQQVFGRRFAADGPTVSWQVQPETRYITAGELTGLAHRVTAAESRLTATEGYAVSTNLPGLLEQLHQTVLVARSTMLVPLLQLVVLAGYALLLVARLISEHRRMEIALLRARGADAWQLARLTVGEGLLLAVPALLLAPLLATLPLRLVAQVPSIRAAGLHLDTSAGWTDPAIWLVSLLTALGCAIALTLPTLRGLALSYVDSQQVRGRGERRGPLQRAGADLAVVAVAAVAMWQLARYGGTASTGSFGGIDPVTVAAPTLALLGGGALVLRLIPLISRAGERLTAGGRGFAPALAVRQLSRRPLRQAGPALLLVMAVAVGVLSLATAGTWRDSQRAQADFQAGADLRVTPGAGLTVLGQGGGLAGLPGVTGAAPVLTSADAQVGQQSVGLFAADARALPGGPDLAGLATGTGGQGTPIPGRPASLTFHLRLTGGQIPGAGHAYDGAIAQFPVAVDLMDGRGVAAQVNLGGLRPDGRTVTRTVDAATLTGAGGRLTYPLTLLGFRYDYTDLPGSAPLTLSMVGVDGLTAPASGQWQTTMISQSGMIEPPAVGSGDGTFLTLTTSTQPHGPDPAWPEACTVVALTAPVPARLPVAVTAGLAAASKLSVGSPLTVATGGEDVQAAVAAIVTTLPGTAPSRPGVLVDLAAFTRRSLADGFTPPAPTEWWLSTRGSAAPAQRALAARPSWSLATVSRQALRDQLENAPLGAALPGSLILGFAAALAFAVIGFAVNAAVAARERRAELAILRALGAGGRQMFGLLVVEQAFLIVFGLLGGVVLGLVMSDLVIPHIVLTVRAASPYPAVRLSVPWLGVAELVCGVTALLLVTLWLLGLNLRGTVAGAGRIGEQR